MAVRKKRSRRAAAQLSEKDIAALAEKLIDTAVTLTVEGLYRAGWISRNGKEVAPKDKFSGAQRAEFSQIADDLFDLGVRVSEVTEWWEQKSKPRRGRAP